VIYNKHLYVRRIREVAVKLDYLLKDVVFVGGSVVALYADHPAADEVRPTDDVDIVVSILSRSEYSVFESDIRALGFQNVVDSPVICRYKINEIIVDVMPADETVLGFTNTWYKKGMEESFLYEIDKEVSVRLMLFPYFIASKIEAHNSRNKSDLRTSKDFEDIVYSFDNRLNPLEDLRQANNEVSNYLKLEMNSFLQDPNFHEGVYSHLNSGTASSRLKRIIGIWSAFVLE
jgi:predicted nucleotidyltransferase